MTTDVRGIFTLPLDPATYQIDYDPPDGSSAPRLTEFGVEIDVGSDMPRTVRLPPAAMVDGTVVAANGTPLPNATIRMFDAGTATTPTMLRAQTQSDGNGRFRAIVAAPAVK